MSEAARELFHKRQSDPEAGHHSWLGSRSCFRDPGKPGELYSRRKPINMEKENVEV